MIFSGILSLSTFSVPEPSLLVFSRKTALGERNVSYTLQNGIWNLLAQKLLLQIHLSQRLKTLVKIQHCNNSLTNLVPWHSASYSST